ncbi:MAG TPA: TetR family transcriptional regulator C-terminal domain-containing protein [Steroidobacteraceae bacterium]|jgi:TetR/AcrR family transcriptional repressor of bet genes|nr:TetR family transcriptional regulator C-terminal domain-containing protein [Steroidobacteraceae bacterium]
MRRLKKKSAARPQPRARNAHSRQHQRLIDACISALHIYGPSRTTVEKVVAIAKMSPGIVRFYFASKAAMLVASLQFLAAEFEEQLMVPVARLKSRPVAALELLVDLYLDPEIASPRKVSVWYAFWGEASSRQEYYDICGQKDEGFAALVRELIERLIIETSQPQLDPDGVALGLIGVLEMLWQDFAFRSEADIDRAAAKRRCMAYLRSIFPGSFAAAQNAGGVAVAPGVKHFAPWVYDNSALFAMERTQVFKDSWQIAGHRGQLLESGDFLAPDLGVERPLILRDGSGELRAFRNSCPEAPHVLTAAASGRLSTIQCAVHGLQFDLGGKRRAGLGAADLTRIDLRVVEDFVLVRSARRAAPALSLEDPWADLLLSGGSRLLRPPSETVISADWKLLVEQWLDAAAAAPEIAKRGWSAAAYARLLGSAVEFGWRARFVAPNHLIESRPDGFTILQVLPRAPGRCVLRAHRYTLCAAARPAAALQYLAARLRPQRSRSMIAVAESTQKGLVVLGDQAAQGTGSAPETTAFRHYLIARVPALASDRPPTSS